MATLLNIAVINALTVFPLAVLAFVVSRLARRPALTHALWVLVLLKFVTPPLLQLPVTIPVADVEHDSNVPVLLPSREPRESSNSVTAPMSRAVEAAQSELSPVVKVESRAAGQLVPSAVTSTLKRCSTIWMRRPDLRLMLLTGWLAGTALWMTWQFVRAVRFRRRVLRGAFGSSELQNQTDRLAARLGLRCVPRLLIVDAAVSPMLWGCGARAKLLFPVDLAKRLDDDACATLLTHELAHFARGDHWVRLLELIATGLFWWHPVVWWARQKIEASEEECCDAWVVGQFPHAPRQYAEALLDTIDFLCESRQPLPPVACGLGQAHFLRHRLTKIMRGAAPKALSQRVRFATAIVAAVLLPMRPFVFGSAGVSKLRTEFLIDPNIATNELNSSAEEVSASANDIPPAMSSAKGVTLPVVVPTTAATSSARATRVEKVWSTAASPDGRFVVRATTTTRRIVLTDLNTNTETDLTDQRITAVAFAPNGEWFAAAGQDGRVTIWDSMRGELLRTVLTHTDLLRSVAVSPRGDTIVAGSQDGAVLLVDLGTGESMTDLPIYSSAVNCVRFSPDGRQLAVAVGDWGSNGRGEVALLNVITGQTEATLPCATAPGALSFVSNDELIVGLWDGRTQLWNLVNQKVVASAQADKNVVSTAAFSPDNPALRKAIVTEEPSLTDEPSPLAVLRGLFANPSSPMN